MVVIGGAKVKDKIGVLSELVKVADKVVIGGRMAYTFLAARGVALGKTHVEHAWLDHAHSVMQQANELVRRRPSPRVCPPDVVAPPLSPMHVHARTAASRRAAVLVPDGVVGGQPGWVVAPALVGVHRAHA